MTRRNILLGIGGGISAYKTPELARQLIAKDTEVVPVLTHSAMEFVTATSLAAVSGQRTRTNLWDVEAERTMSHIELARWLDVLLIAPATANLMSEMAHGAAPDLLTTIYLATTAPTVIAPAMNQQMWQRPATQRNLRLLQDDGVLVFGPDTGDQACGEFGPGRMMEPKVIVERLLSSVFSTPRLLNGSKVLVTAGPTREPIDPVRYISNSSSGRQGYAIAEAARDAGAEVILVSGPTALPAPFGLETISVITTSEMKDAVMSHVSTSDVFFAVAAVADYRPQTPQSTKIKRHIEQSEGIMELTLTETDDIVSCVAEMNHRPYIVGFAAETDNPLAFAREKRVRKNLDAIVVNDVSRDDIGFNSERNEVTLIHESGEIHFAKGLKSNIATQLVSTIAGICHEVKDSISTKSTTD